VIASGNRFIDYYDELLHVETDSQSDLSDLCFFLSMLPARPSTMLRSEEDTHAFTAHRFLFIMKFLFIINNEILFASHRLRLARVYCGKRAARYASRVSRGQHL
jgi:hypothetical protein